MGSQHTRGREMSIPQKLVRSKTKVASLMKRRAFSVGVATAACVGFAGDASAQAGEAGALLEEKPFHDMLLRGLWRCRVQGYVRFLREGIYPRQLTLRTRWGGDGKGAVRQPGSHASPVLPPVLLLHRIHEWQVAG